MNNFEKALPFHTHMQNTIAFNKIKRGVEQGKHAPGLEATKSISSVYQSINQSIAMKLLLNNMHCRLIYLS